MFWYAAQTLDESETRSNAGEVRAFWRTSMSIRPLKWILLGPVLALLLLGNGFASEDGYKMWQVPAGRPEQMWSQVRYDPKLTDPFFTSNEWSYPWWIIKHPDGHFESTRSEDESPIKDPPRLKHTAKCFSTSFLQKEHLIKFCEARFLDLNMIDLSLDENNAAFVETLKVQIRNGMFSCEYSGLTDVPLPKGLMWTTKRQELTLDKTVYRKGDEIKGRVYFELLQEMTDPKYVEKYGRNPKAIKIYGVFKTTVE
jgi:hypothetical protein